MIIGDDPKKYLPNFCNFPEDTFEKLGEDHGPAYLSPGEFPSTLYPKSGVVTKDLRLMICLPTQPAHDPNAPILNVWYFIVTGSPWTYITKRTMKALGYPDSDELVISILDKNTRINCNLSNENFPDVNVIGTDALGDLGCCLYMDLQNSVVALTAPRKDSPQEKDESFLNKCAIL